MTGHAPPWLQQDHVWAYCLYILGDTMWGVNRYRRRLDELYARYG